MNIFLNTKSVRMLLLGFSSGLPILLVFSTLSVWLVKAGVSRSTITMFSWAALAYSFKFIWSPVIDNFKIPIKNFGHRKSWLLISQLMIIFSLIFISFTDPSKTLIMTAVGSVLIAFSSASQDIIVDAYRIESAPQKMQGALSSMYIAGYRIAMLIAGAGSLYLASFFGVEVYDVSVWKKVYLIMASLMLIGVFTTLSSPEPNMNRKVSILSFPDQLRFLISFILVPLRNDWSEGPKRRKWQKAQYSLSKPMTGRSCRVWYSPWPWASKPTPYLMQSLAGLCTVYVP